MAISSTDEPTSGGGASDAFVRETISHTTAVVSNDGTSYVVNLDMPGDGPWFVHTITFAQVGGTYAGGPPSVSFSGYHDAAQTAAWQAFPNFFSSLTSSVGVWIGDQDDGGQLHFGWSDSTSDGSTVQYRVDFNVTRFRMAIDG